MRASPWTRIDVALRQATPFAISVALVLLGVVPLHIPGYERVAPMLPLMAVYHWTLYRPDLMSPVLAFTVGLLADALSGAPIGVNALVFVLVRGAVDSQAKFFARKSFAIVWLGFALVLAGALVVSWVLVSAYHVTPIDASGLPFQYVLTLGVFPILAWALLSWQQAVLRRA